MIVERVKELENFANDFNNRLKTSENELETNSVYQKLNNRTIDNYSNFSYFDPNNTSFNDKGKISSKKPKDKNK